MEITSSRMGRGSRVRNILVTLFVLACILTIIGLAIAVGVYRNKLRTSRRIEHELRAQINNTGYTGPNACISVDCSVTAGEMLARMNLSADPCEDFYQFACGTYANPVNRAPDQGFLQTFGLPAEKTNLLLISELASAGNTYNGNPSTAVKKAKDYYAACMGDTQDDENGRAVLLQLISDLGSWPISSDPSSGTWFSGTWNYEDALTATNAMGVDGLLGVATTFDPRNSSNLIIGIGATQLILDKAELYTNGSVESAYKDYIVTVLTLLYGSERIDEMKQWANKIWTFETSVASIYPTKAELEEFNSPSSIKKLGDISSQISFVNLTTLLNQEFERSGATVDQNTEVMVGTLKYFQSFNKLVTDMGVDAPSVLSVYNVWAAINAIVPAAGTSFKTAYDTLNANVPSLTASDSISWKDCLSATVEALGFATGAMYAQDHVEQIDKDKIDRFLNLTRQQFIEDLPSASWLQPSTRARAAEKANAITWQIGFPQYLNTAAKLDSYYQEFNVTVNNCANILAKRRFEAGRMASKYGKPADKTEWQEKPTVVNAYYHAPTNQIVILAGIMNKPMYDRNFPMSIMYGAMGSVLGHELTHGFDTSGSTYNAQGNKENWWDAQSAAEYSKRALCFINEYSKETFYGQPVSGNETVGENIADCGGIKLAYNAYLKAVGVKADQVDQLLPGLNMTGKQQFFLGFSQLWCVNAQPELAPTLLNDEHSPGPLRVNVVLRNTPQFAEAFSCPDNSKMKPKESDRCQLW